MLFKIHFQASTKATRYYKERYEFESILQSNNCNILNDFSGFAGMVIYKVEAKNISRKVRKYPNVESVDSWIYKDERTWLS
jgi:hypothetical protein